MTRWACVRVGNNCSGKSLRRYLIRRDRQVGRGRKPSGNEIETEVRDALEPVGFSAVSGLFNSARGLFRWSITRFNPSKGALEM